MGLGIPPLKIKIMLESSSLKSTMLVGRLGVCESSAGFAAHQWSWTNSSCGQPVKQEPANVEGFNLTIWSCLREEFPQAIRGSPTISWPGTLSRADSCYMDCAQAEWTAPLHYQNLSPQTPAITAQYDTSSWAGGPPTYYFIQAASEGGGGNVGL